MLVSEHWWSSLNQSQRFQKQLGERRPTLNISAPGYMVLSLISVHGPPQFVLHFSRLLLLLCWRSSQRRAAERRACLMSAPPSWFGPRAVPPFLISLPKQWNICCQLLHVSVCHVLPRPPHPPPQPPLGPPHPVRNPHEALSTVYIHMTHAGVEVIGQARGSVVPRCACVVITAAGS